MRLINADERRTEIDEKDRWVVDNASTVRAIAIPEGATNGDVIETMLPNAEIDTNPYSPSVDIFVGGILMMRVDRNWWDAPYKWVSR